MTPREWWLIYDAKVEGSKDDEPQRGKFSKKERERLLALVDD